MLIQHPLDSRRKDDNRCRAAKWFDGDKWSTFCDGTRGSPGGPVAMATIILMIAEDMQLRGVDGNGAVATSEPVPSAPVRPAGRGRGAFQARSAARAPIAEEAPSESAAALRHVPTVAELAADPADLKIIRDIYGSRAQTLLNALLSFDAYFLHGTTRSRRTAPPSSPAW